VKYKYNIQKWIEDGSEDMLNYNMEPSSMTFYLTQDREARISRVLYENNYNNNYQTYMKTLESIRIEDLFLNVKESGSLSAEDIPLERGIEAWSQES
jgi:hypothetical protein